VKTEEKQKSPYSGASLTGFLVVKLRPVNRLRALPPLAAAKNPVAAVMKASPAGIL